jgi:hypothetical protein
MSGAARKEGRNFEVREGVTNPGSGIVTQAEVGIMGTVEMNAQTGVKPAQERRMIPDLKGAVWLGFTIPTVEGVPCRLRPCYGRGRIVGPVGGGACR